MRNLLIYLCLLTSIAFTQNQRAEILLDTVLNDIINKNGVAIEFNYWFENTSYQMAQPITGVIALYSNNRFYLEFYSEENKIIQMYDGELLSTILIEEKEIKIDNLTENSGFFIQDIFNNYKSKFTSKILEPLNQNMIINLTPIKEYQEKEFNYCIDEIGLPSCLKLPKQCRIGIDSINQKLLDTCLKDKKGYKKNNVLNVAIEIDTVTNQLISITQLDAYQGKTHIVINNLGEKNENCLKIDSTIYKEFEIIDLR